MGSRCVAKARLRSRGSWVHRVGPHRPWDRQGRETSDLISGDGWPDSRTAPKQEAGPKIKDSRPHLSHFVSALRGSAAQQFVLYMKFCFFHSRQNALIFSHFNLSRVSKPCPPGEKLVYQRSHLSNLSVIGTEFFNGVWSTNHQFQKEPVTVIIMTFYEASTTCFLL